ncbi:MAG: hypothetical protein RQM90_12140 [Methanoculleus sp.]
MLVVTITVRSPSQSAEWMGYGQFAGGWSTRTDPEFPERSGTLVGSPAPMSAE